MKILKRYPDIEGVDVPDAVFENHGVYIKAIRQGIGGDVVKQAVDFTDERDLFVRVLNTTSGNLARYFQKALLSRSESEQILDTLRVYRYGHLVFDDPSKVKEYFNMPIPALGGEKPLDLLDTFAGRQLVQETLRKIEYGEFS
jgi:putative toxin-antitoxin system antitoxin component (TIGR02293 family)